MSIERARTTHSEEKHDGAEAVIGCFFFFGTSTCSPQTHDTLKGKKTPHKKESNSRENLAPPPQPTGRRYSCPKSTEGTITCRHFTLSAAKLRDVFSCLTRKEPAQDLDERDTEKTTRWFVCAQRRIAQTPDAHPSA